MNKDKRVYSGIICEAEFEEQMRTTVLPYLKKRCREAYVPCSEGRDSSRKLHVLQYLADRPRGVMMISHGFTESAQKYPEVVYYFLKEGYHVYLPEHCGHGYSYRMTDDPSQVHVDNWKRYIRDFLKISCMAKRKHPGLPVYCFGHSMGGGIAAAAAAWMPDLYKKVILSSPMIRPLTGNIPWKAAVMISQNYCRMGQGRKYVAGQKPYSGEVGFEHSSALSAPRFERYSALRRENQVLQTWSPSYGWLYAAAGLHWYLQKRAWKRIKAPVLLFQAEQDNLVSLRAQEIFAEKINAHGVTACRLIHTKGTKHEAFNASDPVLERYWGMVFCFLEN